VAHIAHPVHPFSPTAGFSLNSAGEYPFWFNLLEVMITFWGQTGMQRAHPLQRSLSITIFPRLGFLAINLTARF
jgi:hypothetical protein